MSFFEDLVGRSEAVPEWKGKPACVKKFDRLGLRIVRGEKGQFFLVSMNKESFLKKKWVNYGSCPRKMEEQDALNLLKDFCLAPILKTIDEESQKDFDFLTGYVVPQETACLEEFSSLMKTSLDKLKADELSANTDEKTVAERFDPLYASVELAVEVARMDDKDYDEVFKTLNI